MDFSEYFTYTGSCPVYSPDGQYVACAQEDRVLVREVDQLQILRVISCSSKVHRIAWCCNSNFLLCTLPQRAQVWSMKDESWSCKIEEGSVGVRHCMWAPDGLHVLAVSDFQVRLFVMSVVDQSVRVFGGPKAAERAIAFSPDGQSLAYGERTDCKDFVSLVDCREWSLRRRIAVTTMDLADLAWSPDGASFVAWDSCLAYKLLVYSADGHCLASYSAYSEALGIRTVHWSPDGQLLAIGSYDQAVRLLSCQSWRPVATLEHRALLKEAGGIAAYQEEDESARVVRSPSRSRSRYIVAEFPLRLPTAKAPIDKPNPKLGVGNLAWSHDGQYLASHNENMPNSVFVWATKTMELISVLVQEQQVRAFKWDPKDERLVICTGGSRLYLWSPNGASCIHIPHPSFSVHFTDWSARGDALVLADRSTFCCAYVGFGAQ